MRILLLAVASAFAITQIASAADLPRKAPAYTPPLPVAYSWTGFYVGLNAGGHWGRDEVVTTASVPNFGAVGAANFNTGAAGTNNPAGFIGGLQLGYNWQINSVVLGLEGDVNGLTGKESRSVSFGGPAPAAGDSFTTQVESSFLATIRGRLGFAFDRWLVYGTGGWAIGKLKTIDTILANGGTTLETTGWTTGGGVEYAFTPNWTAKIEYLHVNLGDFDTRIACVANCNGGVGSTDAVVHHKWTDNIVRAGVNYKLW